MYLQMFMVLELAYISTCVIISKEIEPRLPYVTDWYTKQGTDEGDNEKRFGLEDWMCKYIEVKFSIASLFLKFILMFSVAFTLFCHINRSGRSNVEYALNSQSVLSVV